MQHKCINPDTLNAAKSSFVDMSAKSPQTFETIHEAAELSRQQSRRQAGQPEQHSPQDHRKSQPSDGKSLLEVGPDVVATLSIRCSTRAAVLECL